MAKVKNILYAIIVIHVVWFLLALGLHWDILPGPIAVYTYMPHLLKLNIGMHIYASLYRIFWGLGISIVVGVIIGIMIVRLPKFGALVDPIIYFLYPIPKVALLPVLMLLFGLGEFSKIGMLIVAVVFQVIVSVRDQVKQVSSSLYHTLTVLNANHWEMFRYVTWPASLSGVISAVRIALGSSFAILFFTEVYGTEVGLGYFIMDEWMKMDYLAMYAGIIVISIVAFLMFMILSLLDDHFNRWRETANQ